MRKIKIEVNTYMNKLVNDDLNENQIIKSKEEAEEAYNYTRSLLGTDYERISDIFYHICISEHFQYKILVTRRAYLLYKIFAAIFQYVEKARPTTETEFQIQGEIYNSHSLPLLSTSAFSSGDGNNSNRFLIFDDIIVHGRAINKTFEELKNQEIKHTNISIWCLLKKKNANCLSDEVSERITVYQDCNSEMWKTLSDKLTNIVVRYACGYTSYVDTYRFDFDKEQETEEKFKRIFLNLHRTGKYNLVHLHMSEKFGLKSFIALEKPKNSKNKEISCVRFYQYQHYLIVAPYVFLATVKTEDAFSYAIKVLKDNGIQTIPSHFQQHNSGEYAPLLLKWTVNAVGKKKVEAVLNNCGDDKLSLENSKIVKRNETFEKLDDDFVPIPEPGQSDLEHNENALTSDISFCRETLITSFNKNDNLSLQLSNPDFNTEEMHSLLRDAFTAYAYKVREEDETRARKKQDRCIGLRVSDVVYCFLQFAKQAYNLEYISEELKFNVISEVIALFVENWDCGTSAYDLVTFVDENGKDMVSGFMRNGEQVFRALYDHFSTIYQYFYAYSAQTLSTNISDLCKYGEFLQERVPLQEKKLVRLFNDYMKLNTGYASDVYVVEPPTISDRAFDLVEEYMY